VAGAADRRHERGEGGRGVAGGGGGHGGADGGAEGGADRGQVGGVEQRVDQRGLAEHQAGDQVGSLVGEFQGDQAAGGVGDDGGGTGTDTTTVTVLDIDSAVTSGDPYESQKTAFAVAKELLELTGGDTEVLENYHAGLVAPFCLSAVKSFFDGF